MISVENLKGLHEGDSIALKKYASGNCLEIGTYHGKSAIIASEKADLVVTIDVFEKFSLIKNVMNKLFYAKDYFEYPRSYLEVCETLSDFDNIIVIKGTSENVKIFKDGLFDYCFLDGDHSYEGVKTDFENVYSKIKTGGYILFHDVLKMENAPHIQVYKFIAEIDHKKLEFVERIRHTAVYKKIGG